MARSPSVPEAEGLLPDDVVESLVSQLTPTHKLFLAGIGRGLPPALAAERAGWNTEEAERIAVVYLTSHPVVTPLADHILRLREMASRDGESFAIPGSTSIH